MFLTAVLQFLIISTTSIYGYWHAYENATYEYLLHNSFHRNNSILPAYCISNHTYHESTRPYSVAFIEKLSLWPNLMNNVDKQKGETIYGSKLALQQIHDHQNPKNCSEAKYLISGGWNYGFGSRIHTEGIALAIAMELGRVYLYHPDGDNVHWEANTPFCNSHKKIGLACYYELASKCTLKDALFTQHGDINAQPFYYLDDFTNLFSTKEEEYHDLVSSLLNVKTINLMFTIGRPGRQSFEPFNRLKAIPSSFLPVLRCSPMRSDAYHYWWRAISATYLLRPNLDTLQMMDELAKLDIEDYQSAISIHVRHGDKGVEMKLVNFSEYATVAELLWDHGILNDKELINIHHNQTKRIEEDSSEETMSRIIFLSTEDAKVLTEAEEYGNSYHWLVRYTNLFDRAEQSAANPLQYLVKSRFQHHDSLEYLNMLLNLAYAVKCEAWVCTLASNWCRVIDEMRATVGGKANRFFADISRETCPDPPCIGSGISNFGD